MTMSRLKARVERLERRFAAKAAAKKASVQAKLTGKFRDKRCKREPGCGGDEGSGAPRTRIQVGLMLAALAIGGGCATQPSRSQSMVIEGNTINVFISPRLPAVAVGETNAVPTGVAGGDVLCQAMMIETGGNESNPQTASADTALNLPMGDTAVSALGELIGASITGAFKTAGKTDAAATVETGK